MEGNRCGASSGWNRRRLVGSESAEKGGHDEARKEEQQRRERSMWKQEKDTLLLKDKTNKTKLKLD